MDPGTITLIGVGATSSGVLLGVLANLRGGKATAEVNWAQLARQVAADDNSERDRGYMRLERENERLTEENARLRQELADGRQPPPRKRSGR